MIGWILFVLVVVILIFVIIYFRREIEHAEERINREWEAKFDQRINEWREKEEKRIREDAIRRSVSSRVGRYMDRLAPILTNFEHDPRDVRWLGDPVDLIIFEGYGKSKDSGNIEDFNKIVICDVKTGKAGFTKEEKRIIELVEKKEIEWEEFRVE
ncbi:MAG: Holliday junction resolvase-like protein [Methanosarcinales archaeon]